MEANRPSGELRERILEDVHRMVLWGEPEAAVLRRLEVNGITGPEAAEIYAAAFQERVATIREHYRGKTFQGLLLFAASGVLIWIFMAVFGKMDGKVWAVNGVLFVSGLWKLLDGTSGFLMAKNREGSVADLDA